MCLLGWRGPNLGCKNLSSSLEQIISQPGWDMRRHINTENVLAWSPKLGSVLCYLLFPQRPMVMLYKIRFYFSMSFSKTVWHRVYSWQIVAVGWAAVGVFPKFTWCFHVPTPCSLVGWRRPCQPAKPGKWSSCVGDALNKVPLPVLAACDLHTDAYKILVSRGRGPPAWVEMSLANVWPLKSAPHRGQLVCHQQGCPHGHLGVCGTRSSHQPRETEECRIFPVTQHHPVHLSIFSPFPATSLVPSLPSFISLFSCLSCLAAFC